MIWVVLLLWALGPVLLCRMPRCPEGPAPEPVTKISLIIPARNEEHNIRRLLESVSRLHRKPYEIIVVDDASTDRTSEVASSFGASVQAAPPLPEGWRGKAWACWQGARIATGDALLFLDADTVLQPRALVRMDTAYSRGGCRVLSIGPYHEVKKPYEEFSAIFNLLMFMGMKSFSMFGSPDDPHGLFGPCLLIDRLAYEQVGGHRAVQGEILENMSLCQVLRQRQIPMRCLGGRGVVHVRMYPDGFGSLVEGWTKAFASGAAKTEPLTLLLTVAWMTGGMLAFSLWALSPFHSSLSSSLGWTYAAYAVMIFIMLRAIGRFAVWSAALYPLLLITFFVVFARSAILGRRGGRVRWKGRVIEGRAGK